MEVLIISYHYQISVKPCLQATRYIFTHVMVLSQEALKAFFQKTFRETKRKIRIEICAHEAIHGRQLHHKKQKFKTGYVITLK